MARRREMTWNGAERRWHKRYRGKSYAISPRQLNCPATMEQSRDAANDWWEQKQQAIDAAEYSGSPDGKTVASVAAFAENRLEQAKELQDAYGFSAWQPIVRAYKSKLENREALPESADEQLAAAIATAERLPVLSLLSLSGDDLRHLIDECMRAALARVAGTAPAEPWNAQKPNDQDPTLKDAIAKFIDYKRAEGDVKPERIVSLFRDLNRMRSVLESSGERPISSFDKPAIAALRQPQTFSANWKPRTFRRYYQAIGMFLRWAYGEYDALKEIPRNLNTLRAKKQKTQKQRTFTADELAAIFATLDELANKSDKSFTARQKKNDKLPQSQRRKLLPVRNSPRFVKLAFLLMLNTGATQKDLSDLQQSEVDWHAGTITRRRSKEQDHDSTPIVCYRLWPATFALLKMFRNVNSEHVLTSESGTCLVTTRETDGKFTKTDVLRLLLRRMKKQFALPIGTSPKSFRKTGVTALKSFCTETELRELYLGHAPATVREIFYEQDSPEFQARFDAVIDELGKRLGVA